MLFPSAVQPSILSLFSSTGSDPLSLFNSSSDSSLPSDSFIHLLHDQLSGPLPHDPRSLLRSPKSNDKEDEGPANYGHELDQTVLHIQSPTIPTTYIQCPPTVSFGLRARPDNALGIKHPWMHLQVRNLGREWAFEAGIVDQAGRVGIIRLSTFQILHFALSHLLRVSFLRSRDKTAESPYRCCVAVAVWNRQITFQMLFPMPNCYQHDISPSNDEICLSFNKPRLKVNHQKSGSSPLLLLPLSFPPHSGHLLTPWGTISVHFPSLLPYFSSPLLRSRSKPDDQDEDDFEHEEPAASSSSNAAAWTQRTLHLLPAGAIPASIPSGKYSHVSYVRVYANCRLRRIWFADNPANQKVPWEFELYSSD